MTAVGVYSLYVESYVIDSCVVQFAISHFSKSLHIHLQVIVRLNKGLGISLVDQTPEELVYVMFRDVTIEYVQENDEQSLRADVHSLQVSSVTFRTL